jgi:hypothetical protein
MTENQIAILLDILKSKKEEIFNYDMDEPDADEVLDAIQAFINQYE